MKAIQVLSWTTTFPLEAKERKADWSAYEGETKDGCLTLHGLTAEDAEKIVRVLHSYEEVRAGGDKRQTNFGQVLAESEQQRPPLGSVLGTGGGSGGSSVSEVVRIARDADVSVVDGNGKVLFDPKTYDLFPEDICKTTDFRAVLVHWMRGGVVDRAELLKLAEANQGRLRALERVKDVKKKFSAAILTVDVE